MSRLITGGATSYLEAITVPTALNAETNTLTLMAWYRPKAIENGTVFGIGKSSGSGYLALGMNASGNVFMEGGTGSDSLSTGTLTTETWSHIVATLETKVSLSYLNGVAGTPSSTSTNTALNRINAGALTLGGSRLSFAHGEIAHLAAWNVKLTATQIKELSEGKNPYNIERTHLVAYWPLEGKESPEKSFKGEYGESLTVAAAAEAGTTNPTVESPEGGKHEYSVSVSETLSPSQTITRAVTVNRTPSETLSPSQAVTRATAPKRSTFDMTSAGNVYWGADIDGDVYSIGQGDAPYNATTYNTFEEHAGASPAIVHFSDPWLTWDGFGTPSSSRVGERGGIVMKSIGGNLTNLNEVAEGKLDSTIETWATKAAEYGKPVFLRPWWEANGTWWSWGRAANFITAWKRLYEKVNAKASNVAFVYCPNIIYSGEGSDFITSMFPGTAYVDWMGMDGYAGENPLKLVSHKNPKETFEPTYKKLLELAPEKPIVICETATSEYGNDKARWISELFRLMPRDFPKIKAIVWFNNNIVQGEGRLDWPIESSASAQQAFKEGIRSSYYVNARPGELKNGKPELISRQISSATVRSAFPRSITEWLGIVTWPEEGSFPEEGKYPTSSGATDVVTRVAAVARSVTEIPTTSDSPTRATSSFFRSIVETLTTSDAIKRVFAGARNIADEHPTTDSPSAGGIKERSVEEILSTSDAPSRATAATRTQSESISTSESPKRQIASSRTVTNILSASDSPVRATAAVRAVTQALTTSDAVTRALTASRAIAQILSTADQPTHSVSVFIRNVTEALSTVDVIKRVYNGLRSITDHVRGEDHVHARIVTIYHDNERVQLRFFEPEYKVTANDELTATVQAERSFTYVEDKGTIRINLGTSTVRVNQPDEAIYISKIERPEIVEAEYDDGVTIDLVNS